MVRWLKSGLLILSACSLSIALAQPEIFVFHATFGDNTQVYDGTVDSIGGYGSLPPCFLGWANQHGSGIADTDNLRAPVNSSYPFVLRGYPAFGGPNTVYWAHLRFDIFFDRSRGQWDTEEILFWDERSCSPTAPPAAGFAYGFRLRDVLPDSVDRTWLALHIDLKTGQAWAYQIDSNGNPTGSYWNLPPWGALGYPDRGVPQDVLRLAKDGNLFGIIADDLVPSYVALYAKALRCGGGQIFEGDIQADINGDGRVDDADLLFVLFNFGASCTIP